MFSFNRIKIFEIVYLIFALVLLVKLFPVISYNITGLISSKQSGQGVKVESIIKEVYTKSVLPTVIVKYDDPEGNTYIHELNNVFSPASIEIESALTLTVNRNNYGEVYYASDITPFFITIAMVYICALLALYALVFEGNGGARGIAESKEVNEDN